MSSDSDYEDSIYSKDSISDVDYCCGYYKGYNTGYEVGYQRGYESGNTSSYFFGLYSGLGIGGVLLLLLNTSALFCKR